MIINLSNPTHQFLMSLLILVLIVWSGWAFTADRDGSLFRMIPPVAVGFTALAILLNSILNMLVMTFPK